MNPFIVRQVAAKVKEIFSEHINTEDLNKDRDQDYDDKLISRCLAAFAIYSVGDTDKKDAGLAVIDGGDDNGVDAIYFNQNTKKLVIVQAKYIKDGISEPSASEIRTFKDGISDFLDGKIDKFNKKTREKKLEMQAISQFGTKVDIVLVHTGKKDIAKHGETIIKEMMTSLNGGEDIENPLFSFHHLHGDEIFNRLSKDTNQSSVDLEFHLKEWGKIDGKHTAYYGRIYGTKLGEWWENYSDRLFQDNIRKMLGETSINGQIAETAKNTPEMFWYFNNGITLLCDKIEKNIENRDNRDFGFFKTVNASIVNGAQTVSVVGKLMKEGVDLSRLEVPFRAIEIDQGSIETKKAITRTNNTQNEILSKDFIAQDETQESLQKQARLLNYTYQVKRDTNFKTDDSSFDLNEAIEALVLLSKQASLAATFRNEVGKFHITDRAPYKTLFNPSLSGYKLINSIKILRELQEISKDILDDLQSDDVYGRKNQILTNGLLLTGQISLKDKNLNNLNKEIIDPKEIMELISFKDTFNKVFDYCETKYKGNYLRTLFRNSSKCLDIFNNIS